MAMNNDVVNREERRRRIVERGSDRMALITGRLQSLVPSTPPPSPISSSSFPYNHMSYAGSENKKIAKEAVSDDQEEKDCNIGSQIECGQEQEYKKKNIQTSSESSSSTLLQIKRRPKFFSSKRLNSSIIVSETPRIFCALIIAFLVVLSYVDYPLFGRNIVTTESVVASRPLYILLLTDVSIVIARLHLENRRAPEDEGAEGQEEEVLRIRDDGHDWTQALRFLERGLVVYQAIRGIFIDCSVYAVVVICGLSLV
ncbi:hypothetical protein L484_026179 [Morus notabilis]|uniref:Uncharacterized protein n=1 Tax=Morus notabilis TaxID=981085 RepID=W9RGT9_9ROSA|nr:uncharacterized protein LOC21408845 [Morus notabilis]EXB74485.1 hypothetical protein L484_026179 [Morus notabilis]